MHIISSLPSALSDQSFLTRTKPKKTRLAIAIRGQLSEGVTTVSFDGSDLCAYASKDIAHALANSLPSSVTELDLSMNRLITRPDFHLILQAIPGHVNKLRINANNISMTTDLASRALTGLPIHIKQLHLFWHQNDADTELAMAAAPVQSLQPLVSLLRSVPETCEASSVCYAGVSHCLADQTSMLRGVLLLRPKELLGSDLPMSLYTRLSSRYDHRTRVIELEVETLLRSETDQPYSLFITRTDLEQMSAEERDKIKSYLSTHNTTAIDVINPITGAGLPPYEASAVKLQLLSLGSRVPRLQDIAGFTLFTEGNGKALLAASRAGEQSQKTPKPVLTNLRRQ